MTAAATVGYLAGTLPSADIASRLAGRRTEVRASGSGNPGAANAAAVLGNRWGLAVLGADMGKGVAAGLVGRALAGDTG
ncbi:glycerol-3-phosphate acyltransferase, partial [Iamia sp.]|uniref:glycerol-3-phosphate acyltransferase n=1 Tax=Iamia sp. TaxID=2722710 RepID=UPI002CACBD14